MTNDDEDDVDAIERSKHQQKLTGERPSDETKRCWECGCSFTYADARANDGDWSSSYCGC